MRQNTVYICTRNRIPNVKKIVPRWLEQNFHVVLVIEKQQRDDHIALCEEMDWEIDQVTIELLPLSNRGLGHARNHAVWHASQQRLKSIIYSDDDIRPATDSDMSMLTEEARRNDVLAIGAATRIQDHFTKGAITANHGVILAPGCWAHRMFALNVRNTMAVGNFDIRLGVLGDDDELQRRGILNEFPWAVHTDVWAESIGARFQAGGVEALPDVKKKRLANHQLMHDMWPAYVSNPPKPYRTQWQKMMDEYIPEWRDRSAMHGGGPW